MSSDMVIPQRKLDMLDGVEVWASYAQSCSSSSCTTSQPTDLREDVEALDCWEEVLWCAVVYLQRLSSWS